MILGYFPYFWLIDGSDSRAEAVPDAASSGTTTVARSGSERQSSAWSALYIIDGLVFYLGFIWIFIDKRKRCWHDLLAGTVVVKKLA